MKTLIVYCSNHGFSEKCASIIADKLKEDTTLDNLKNNNSIDIQEFDTIIIGMSIHAGKIQKEIKQFLDTNEASLLKKKIALYLCCMDNDKVDEYFETEIPQKIRESAVAKVHMGYALNFEKMNLLMRSIVKKITKASQSEENIKTDNVDLLIEKISIK